LLPIFKTISATLSLVEKVEESAIEKQKTISFSFFSAKEYFGIKKQNAKTMNKKFLFIT
jgi:hypothetical protein